MPWPVHPTGFFGARGDNDTYRIERSLRFNSADSATLDRTPSNSGNRTAWTQSFWIKRSKLGTEQHFFESGGANFQTFFDVNDSFRWYENGGYIAITTQVFRDTSAWYHFVLTWDSANATAGDRFRIYVNGVRVTSFSTTSNPSLNQSSGWNQASTAHYFGRYNASALYYFDGYLTEAYFIDGQALTPSSFGETDAITGRWKAKAYSGTYGTNGFYLKFADNSGTTDTTLGKDSSGNGNNWTPNNFSVTAGAGNDSLVDSPTNYGTDSGVGGEVRGNYCVINALNLGSGTASDGNLSEVIPAASGTSGKGAGGNIAVSSGKWYAEFVGTVNSNFAVGVIDGNNTTQDIFTSGVGYYSINGNKYINGSVTSYGSTYTTNDVIGVALDISGGTVTFYKNNISQGSITLPSLPSGGWRFHVSNGTSLNTQTYVANFGQRPFAYTAPTGFKALCTTNLPTPTIQKPSKYMDVVAYTGTGASNSISSLGFSPDFVWIKNRGGATDHAIYDTTRGTQAQLSSNTLGSSITSSTGLTAFGSNGFTIGTSSLVNTSGTQYVAWAWDEAPIAGMDIVSYTGNGANRTISHGLGVSPKMMIVKNTSSTSDWGVYHSNLTSASYYIYLSSTNGENIATTMWNGTAPTSSVFSVGTSTNVNANNDNYIAYLFAEIEGFSKFGSYTGNNSSDGPFVWCGFRPRWVLIKDSGFGGTWAIFDAARSTANVIKTYSGTNNASAEDSSYDQIDFLSNGFKMRAANATAAANNLSGYTYIFAAFAESPFKYARAR